MKVVKDTKEDPKNDDFLDKWKKHKEQYLKDHSLDSMVYENGAAIGLLYKEIQRLNTLLITIIKDGNENNDNK